MAVREFIQCFLIHEQNDFFVLGQTQRQADGGRSHAVIGHILAIDAQRAFTVLTTDTDAALGNAWKYQYTLGSGHKVFMLWVELIKLLHRDVHALIDLSLGGSE